MSRIIFNAKLLNVDSSTGQNGVTWRLIFESKRFDKGLDQWVPCSQNVKITDDHTYLLDTYRSYKNKEIYLCVEQSTMDRNIYYRTTGDGKPLQLEEKQAQKVA